MAMIEKLTELNRNRKQVKSQGTKTSLPDLPSFVLIDIISRLPLKDVFTCRCVCKSWHNMLEPFFAKRYMFHAPTVLMLRLRNHGIENPKNLYLVNLHNRTPLLRTSASLKRDKPSFPPGNSCHGLVCLCNVSSGNPVCVWNPLLGEYKILPKGIYTYSQYTEVSGLGFCPATNEYKVIRILKPVAEYSWQAEIYTLGTDSWRIIGVAPYSFINCQQRCGTYFNGALHWLVRGHDSQLICTFDIQSERFLCFPPPLVRNQCYWSNLGVFDDCLYICGRDNIVFNPDIEIWVMKNYGFNESWAKMVNIKNPWVEWWNRDRQLQLIKVFGNGEVLLLFCANVCLLYYNCKDRTFDGPHNLSFNAIAHFPSFVSLEEITKGNYSKVLNVKST